MALQPTVNLMEESNALTNYNFLKPVNFHIRIDRKRFKNLEFYANVVNHPGVSVTTPTLPVPRLGNLSIPGDTLNVDELSMDVLVDEDMNSYIEMFNWLNTTVQSNYKTKQDSIKENYIPESDITISILTSHNNVSKIVKYIDCVPTSVGAFTLQSNVTDAQPLVFPVTFRTSYFEII